VTGGKKIGMYRDYNIVLNQKPIPDRGHDWDFTHVDYDGPGDSRCGTAASVEGCKSEIDEIEGGSELDPLLEIMGVQGEKHK
jgi:hypothetical protein